MPEDVDTVHPAAGQLWLGGLVRAHRARLGLTQEQLAERAGLSERTLRNLEAGRSGRPYPDTIRRLADALELSGRHRDQLEAAARGATRDLAPEPMPPSLLPPSVTDFTGRDEEVAAVLRLLAGDGGEDPAHAVVISAVAGKPGIGKTTLAVHVAHRLRTRFPGGQLYVNLQGTQAHPLEPVEVLARFLRALGAGQAARHTDTWSMRSWPSWLEASQCRWVPDQAHHRQADRQSLSGRALRLEGCSGCAGTGWSGPSGA